MQDINFINLVYSIIILIMSVVIHEVSHGYAALFLGDPTAKYEKRLTLNPLRHIDLIGSIIVPLITFFAGGFVFGWAKPVPYNPYNLKNPKRGEAIIALAGPLSNFLIALVAALVIDFGATFVSAPTLILLFTIVVVNISLMIFNLVPIPPLDGSKILFSVIPAGHEQLKAQLMRYSIFIFLIFVFFFSQYLSGIVTFFVRILVPGAGL